MLGPLFESLVAPSLTVYAQAAEATVAHLRTHDGAHEVYLLVVRGDGRVVAVEVKLHQTVSDADVRHLTWLRDRLGDRLLDAVVVTTGGEAYRRRDGVAQGTAARRSARAAESPPHRPAAQGRCQRPATSQHLDRGLIYSP